MSARHVALAVLDGCLSRQSTMDAAFERAAGAYKLEGSDRAFARALSAMTLRRLGEVDAALKPFLKRPLPAKALTARNILRLGATQLLFLKTPPHAAVSETTDLATGRASAYRGLVNAVLRRLSEAGPADLSDAAVARLNTPGWLWESWLTAYGPETTKAIAEAHHREPPLDFSILRGRIADWETALEATTLPTAGVRRRAGGGRTPDLPGFADGDWFIQDAAAALPAMLLGDVKGQAVIDLCAAPGGKSMQLAAAGADVTSLDSSVPRLERLHENMRRTKLSVTTVLADGAKWRPDTPADAVLLDAPCTATGTIRRRPDVGWTKQAADVRALATVQAGLLRAAGEMVRPGGRIVYACCSLQPEEGPELVAAFLKETPGFERDPVLREDFPGLPKDAITRAGELRTLPSMWPEIGGMDGFYAARLVKAG